MKSWVMGQVSGNRYLLVCGLFVVVCGLFITGCSKEQAATKGEIVGGIRLADKFDRQFDTKGIVDDLGRNVAVPQKPERIICLAAADVEIIFALGKEDCLVGRPSFQEYPKEALKIKPVGGMYNPQMEEIVGTGPDLVIFNAGINEGIERSVKRFEGLGLCFAFFNYPKSFSSIMTHIEKIGGLIGAPLQAKALVNRMDQQTKEIKDKVAGKDRPMVYVEHYYGKAAAACAKSRESELIEMAGGENIFNNVRSSSIEVNFEEVIKRNPEVIIRLQSPGRLNEDILRQIKNRPGWRNISAVKNNRIHVVNSQHTWAGPRIIEGLKDFARYIHPELRIKAGDAEKSHRARRE